MCLTRCVALRVFFDQFALRLLVFTSQVDMLIISLWAGGALHFSSFPVAELCLNFSYTAAIGIGVFGRLFVSSCGAFVWLFFILSLKSFSVSDEV